MRIIAAKFHSSVILTHFSNLTLGKRDVHLLQMIVEIVSLI